TVGAAFGWRAMFAIGGLPAFLVAWIRRGVREPARWQAARGTAGPTMGRSFTAIFSPGLRRRTILNAIYLLVSIVGLWAGSVYVPASVTVLATRAGQDTAAAARLASYGTMLLSVGTILGCLAVPALADRLGRRGALATFYAVMAVSIALAFGYVFYLPAGALSLFL